MERISDDSILTGNETPELIATYLMQTILDGLEEHDEPVDSCTVSAGFQPYITLRLRNGAEWQITPVRSSWPEDGTSTQCYDDEECSHCGRLLSSREIDRGMGRCFECHPADATRDGGSRCRGCGAFLAMVPHRSGMGICDPCADTIRRSHYGDTDQDGGVRIRMPGLAPIDGAAGRS